MTVYMLWMRSWLGVLLVVGFSASSGVAAAQSKAPARAKPAAKAPAKPVPAPKAKKAVKPAEPEESEPAPEASEESSKPTTEGETRVKAAGTTEPTAGKTPLKVKEKEGPEGVKTYQFGALEVEGRLKSPQLIYFLRRVRAEFEAGALGHRSFLGELSDTRNEPTFR